MFLGGIPLGNSAGSFWREKAPTARQKTNSKIIEVPVGVDDICPAINRL